MLAIRKLRARIKDRHRRLREGKEVALRQSHESLAAPHPPTFQKQPNPFRIWNLRTGRESRNRNLNRTAKGINPILSIIFLVANPFIAKDLLC